MAQSSVRTDQKNAIDIATSVADHIQQVKWNAQSDLIECAQYQEERLPGQPQTEDHHAGMTAAKDDVIAETDDVKDGMIEDVTKVPRITTMVNTTERAHTAHAREDITMRET